MVTKHKRQEWRRNTLGERVDSRHFAEDFEQSGWRGGVPEPEGYEQPSLLKWIAGGLLLAVGLGVVVGQVIVPVLRTLRGLA